MENARLKIVTDGSVGDLPAQIRSFERHLRIKNLAPNTITTYVKHARWMAGRMVEPHRACPCEAPDHAGGPVDVADLSRERIEDYIVHLQKTTAASTVATRFRSLQQFFRWLVDEGELEVSPLAKVARPKVPEIPVPVVTDAALGTLLKSVAGRDFDSRRDNAILRVFLDCGVRLDELGRLAVESVDF